MNIQSNIRKQLEELIDLNAAPIKGDIQRNSNSEIEASTVDVDGIDQTTDDVKTNAIQARTDQYGFGASIYGRNRNITVEAEDNITKKVVERLLGDKKEKENILKKYEDSDINSNKIPDLEDLSRTYQKSSTANKVKALVDSVRVNELNGEEKAIVVNFIVNNIDISSIPNDYKNIIKKSF
jgi:hypothetical protein